MHRRTSSSRLTFAVLGLTSVAWSAIGRAAPARPLTWWIETRPWTCSAETGPLARQVQLACDATGRCAIASDEPSADRRGVLVCGDVGWTLEARDAKNQLLWTLALGTTDDDARLRKAGVWIARSEGEGPIDQPLSTTAATTASTVPPSPAVRPEQDSAPNDPKAAHLSFATLFHGSSPRSNSKDYGPAWGATALLLGSAPHTTGPLIFGIGGTAEYSSEKTDYSIVRGGPILGLGASVGDFRFGLLVEGGPALLHAPMDGSGFVLPICTASQCVPPSHSASALRPYAQASLFAQWSLPGPIHPFLSPTATWIVDKGPSQIPNAIIGLDVGFVWGHI